MALVRLYRNRAVYTVVGIRVDGFWLVSCPCANVHRWREGNAYPVLFAQPRVPCASYKKIYQLEIDFPWLNNLTCSLVRQTTLMKYCFGVRLVHCAKERDLVLFAPRCNSGSRDVDMLSSHLSSDFGDIRRICGVTSPLRLVHLARYLLVRLYITFYPFGTRNILRSTRPRWHSRGRWAADRQAQWTLKWRSKSR